jgi:hypothetical protein
MDGDAYSSVCTMFNKLCPQLVPSPLWDVSIPKLIKTKTKEFMRLSLEPGVIEEQESF